MVEYVVYHRTQCQGHVIVITAGRETTVKRSVSNVVYSYLKYVSTLLIKTKRFRLLMFCIDNSFYFIQFTDVCSPHVKADVVFVLDTSMSEGQDIVDKQKAFVKEFVSKFRVGPLNYRYQFALVTYALETVIHFKLDTYQNDSELLEAIGKVKHTEAAGPTFTGKALKVVRQHILPDARNEGITVESC